MTITHQPIVLIVLDGWGYRENPQYNAIASAQKPTWDHLWATYPHTLISGSGLDVGLPVGQMGNSEVGHLHMGVGRSVPQDFVRINDAIADGSFNANPVINYALHDAIKHNSAVHIIGLLSPGGVHSHEEHIRAVVSLAAQKGVQRCYVHAILDGRDTPPRSALPSIALIDKALHQSGYSPIVSLTGRYYAMDRDHRWERTQTAYDLYTSGLAAFHATSPANALELAYERDENDEFVQTTAIHAPEESPITIQDGDIIIFMNFRADRVRQLTHAFINPEFSAFERKKTPELTHFVSLTAYASNLPTEIAFPPIDLTNVFGECVANAHLKQLRIAETEKYAHVTFFFNGGREQPFDNEYRIMVPSPKVATYDLQPAMNAPELTDKLCEAIRSRQYAAIICNFANPDMVGHTGNMLATVTAIEVIDECLSKIIAALKEVGGEAIITADHGNAEFMYDELTGQAHTAHTSNPVPVIYVGRNAKSVIADGNLADIAVTLLTLLGLSVPTEMTGRALFELD
ncbi:MAG: 2,3-bisphosphoglycerate-independent phosphoglycerate mutase [Pseudomonadota bacterium]|nr:2,3-bisphosphoglycerate-independent phosphoglycerate mutase [Pseudomonadota bacterium]